ncbi:transmembrane protein, putative, partial [Rhizoctonia solani AG-3 Rhs1AP]
MMCVLLLRVWAVWGRKLWMLAVLLLVFVSSQLPPALLIGKTIQKLDVIDNPLPGLITGCVTTSSSSASAHWVHLFISSLTYESTLFLLTVVRAWSFSRRGVGTPIMTLLTRDGAWYCLVAIASVGLTAVGTSIPKANTDGSSAFSVLHCNDIVYMLSITPPTSWVLHPYRSKHRKRCDNA